MKGLELPINVLIIIVIAVIVLIGMSVLYLTGMGSQSEGVILESTKTSACNRWVGAGGCQGKVAAADINFTAVTCGGVVVDDLAELCSNCYNKDCTIVCNCLV